MIQQMKPYRCSSPTELKRIFDKGTGKELINTLRGELNGKKTILYRTETKAYIKMQEGEITDIAYTVSIRKNAIDPNLLIRQVTTDNIITLLFYA